MRIFRLLMICVCAAALAWAGGPAQGWAAQPAFGLAPEAMLQLARAERPVEGKPVLELLEAFYLRMDAQGRRETRYRYIFRVDHESAVEGWRTIGSLWKPWNQERPVLKARVITPDGKAHWLEPGTIGEVPVQEQASVFDDRRRLVAPLPQLCVGAVAEVEVLTRETAPAFPSGAMISVSLHQPVPVLQTEVVIETPETMPLAWKLLGVPEGKPVRTQAAGLSRLVLNLGRLDPREEDEPHEPAGGRPLPVLIISTVPDWSTAAQAYHAIVEAQLAGADLSPRIPEGVRGSQSVREKVALLVEAMNREIKYTGLEFGEASVVPRKPAETYARGYGDCKDKATLLVGLLRAVGIPAHVALLRTGPGMDVDEGLPGLNGFDHAIVHVPGPEPIWVDPTAELYRAGDVPFMDQGRRALIAAPGTRSLTRTPESTSAENLTREIRTITLADSGPARATERSMPSGLGEAGFRYEMANDEPKRLRENLTKYIKGNYDAKDLGAVAMGDPRDLRKPFTLELEAVEAGIGRTWDFEASVTVNLWNMTEKLRKYVPVPSEKASSPDVPRKQPFVFPEPYCVEWEYRIVPPDGFKPRSLPAADVVAFGPATLARRYELAPDGAVLAHYRMDSGKKVWSAAEYDAARKAIGEFGRSAPIALGFDLEAELLLTSGRIRESIQAYRIYVEHRPGKAAPLGKLAMAMLKGGMGEAARERARQACSLEPQSAFAHRTLGFVLLHDLVGRQFKKGWDREGTIKALKEAKRLDPSDAVARKNLGIVYEYNLEGIRYGTGAQLDQAIAEYQSLKADLKNADLEVNLLVCLARTGRAQDLEALAQSLPPSANRSAWLLVGAALRGGAERAIAEAPGIIPDASARRSAFISAGETLIPLRRYAEAAGLLVAGAVGANDAPAVRGRAAFLAKTRRMEDVVFDSKQPASVVWEFLRAVVVRGKEGKDLAPYFTPDLWAALSRDPELKTLQQKAMAGFAGLRQAGFTQEAAFDLLVALAQVAVEGDAARGGLKVQLVVPDADRITFRVSQVSGTFRIAVMDEQFSMFGVEALRLLKSGDLEGARAWIDSAREVAWCGDKEDPLSGSRLCRFWTKGQPATAEEVRFAAAVLQITDAYADSVVPTLEAARKAAIPARQADIDLALSTAYLARDAYAKLEPIARAQMAAHPDSKIASNNLCMAFIGQKKWSELLQVCEEGLKGHPDDLRLIANKAQALAGLGRQEEKLKLLQAQVDRGSATASEFNNLAWGLLMAGQADERALDLARRSLLLKGSAVGSQHTLASILAERGEVGEALELLLKMLQSSETGEPRSEDWFVFGRIAEHLGEKELALARYRKVALPGRFELEEDSCHLLSQRRIQAIQK